MTVNKGFSMRYALLISLLAPVITFAQVAPRLPDGYCYVGCRGSQPVTPYNFSRAASRFGDPNTGGRLGSTVLVPSEDGGTPDTPVATLEWLRELTEVEGFAARECGRSLNDDSWGDIIDVVAPCGDLEKILEADAADARRAHSRTGTAPMSDVNADRAYQYASNNENQRNLREKLYCRFIPGGQGSNALSSEHCEPFDLQIGTDRTLAAGMKSKTCRMINAPRFNPEIRQVLGGGVLECRRGLPPRTSVRTEGEVDFGISVFNNRMTLLGVQSRQVGTLNLDSTHTSRTMNRGVTICRDNEKAPKLSIDKTCPVARTERKASATFMVGPIPITVEAGAFGEVGTADFARVSPMWANGRVGPYVETAGFASAFINLLIIRGGVEARLTFLNDKYFLTSFSGVMHLPQGNGVPREGFYFSEQLTGVNQLNALGGKIDAFASVPVPKFIGIRWKKFRVNLFRWNGVQSIGYVIDRQVGPTELSYLQ
jgi:hypothetical protein